MKARIINRLAMITCLKGMLSFVMSRKMDMVVQNTEMFIPDLIEKVCGHLYV